MSLLNQVLQDLEKRNAEDRPVQIQNATINAVENRPKTLLYFFLALLCLVSIVIYLTFDLSKKTSPPSAVIIQNKTSAIKIPTTATNILLQKQVAVKKAHKLAPVQQKSTIKNPSYKQKKSHSAKIDKKHSIKPEDNKQKAKRLFDQIKNQPLNKDLQPTLETILQFNPEHLKARILLAKTLLQQGLLQQATGILQQGLKLFPTHLSLIILRSQLYLHNKQAPEALAILQKVSPQHHQDEIYLSLLASAYQQNNENIQSLKTYQKLLIINPQQATYWLGLAIALEKQGDKTQALNAYHQALEKNTLKISIVNYIKQRINALN